MAEIIKVYRQSLPKMKFVGRCYSESDKENGTFGNKWKEWFSNDLFSPLKIEGGEPYEDCNAYCGLSRCRDGEPFQYWIGVFMPCDAAVPEGYEAVEFEASDIGVCWVKGKEPDIYFTCCMEKLGENGMEWKADKNGVKWCYERYVCPRFTSPDKDGNVILDMCFYI